MHRRPERDAEYFAVDRPQGGRPRALFRRALLAAAFAPAACQAATLPVPAAGGPLRLLGGFQFDADVPGFGGLSGLHLAPDLTLTVISDTARHATLRLALHAAGRPEGVALLRRGPLRDGAGRPLARGHTGDAEALARLPDGTWLVGFERWHRIRAYRDLDGPGAYVEAPPGLEHAPGNGGLEALTVLADGRWLALAEELAVPGGLAGWVGGPGRWQGLTYRPAPGMAPTDATALPGGGALVVERGFSFLGGFSARVVRLGPIAPGATLDGEEVLRLDGALAENWEGISAARIGGRLLVALVSDDNENRLQRSLLLVGVLEDQAG